MILERNLEGLTKELKENDNVLYNRCLLSVIIIQFRDTGYFPIKKSEATEKGTVITFKELTTENLKETETKINEFVQEITKNIDPNLEVKKLKIT